MEKMQQAVLAFHKKFGGVWNEKPTLIDDHSLLRRVRLIVEESGEFARAANKHDLIDMADALCDILYVTLGTFVELGIDAEPVFDEVQRSNMTKMDSKDAGGKIQKGFDFSPPNIALMLSRQGWNAF